MAKLSRLLAPGHGRWCSMNRIGAIFVDDRPAFHLALAGYLAEQVEIELIGTGASIGAALELAAKCGAGVIALGLTNAHENLALIEAIARFRPDLGILLFASRDDDVVIGRAVQLGVRAVVLR